MVVFSIPTNFYSVFLRWCKVKRRIRNWKTIEGKTGKRTEGDSRRTRWREEQTQKHRPPPFNWEEENSQTTRGREETICWPLGDDWGGETTSVIHGRRVRRRVSKGRIWSWCQILCNNYVNCFVVYCSEIFMIRLYCIMIMRRFDFWCKHLRLSRGDPIFRVRLREFSVKK